MKFCITGANSSVGRNLLQHLAQKPEIKVVALVRSSSALSSLPAAANIEAVALDYTNHEGLLKVFAGAHAVVHLAGVLFESKRNTYHKANVDSTAAVVRVARELQIPKVVFISVLGADATSPNRFYKTKGVAEALVINSGPGRTVIRTPLLLGPFSAGGRALLREAQGRKAKLLGGGHHAVRPLDVDDLSSAILAVCLDPSPMPSLLELCGPERLPYRALVTKMAALLRRKVRITTIPLGLAKIVSGLIYAMKGAGMTPEIIDVITASENAHENADKVLGIELTPLAQTLAKIASLKG